MSSRFLFNGLTTRRRQPPKIVPPQSDLLSQSESIWSKIDPSFEIRGKHVQFSAFGTFFQRLSGYLEPPKDFICPSQHMQGTTDRSLVPPPPFGLCFLISPVMELEPSELRTTVGLFLPRSLFHQSLFLPSGPRIVESAR